jgi:hypothetical protein
MVRPAVAELESTLSVSMLDLSISLFLLFSKSFYK